MIPPGKNASGARVEFFARSGNTSDPENNWSPWAGPYSNISGDKLDCPPARFVQWKAVLHGGGSGPAPEIDWVSVAYLPKNVAPEVTAIALQTPGIRVQGMAVLGQAMGQQIPVPLRMPQPPASASSSSAFNARDDESECAERARSILTRCRRDLLQKGYQSVLWTADDANDDQLEFAVYFRGENETTWKLLKDKLDTHFYSWDTTAMPDGAYYLKIVASDAPSNPAGEGLTSESRIRSLHRGQHAASDRPTHRGPWKRRGRSRAIPGERHGQFHRARAIQPGRRRLDARLPFWWVERCAPRELRFPDAECRARRSHRYGSRLRPI